MHQLESRLLAPLARRPSPDTPRGFDATPCPATRPETRVQRLRQVASLQTTRVRSERDARFRQADSVVVVGDRRAEDGSVEPGCRAGRWESAMVDARQPWAQRADGEQLPTLAW